MTICITNVDTDSSHIEYNYNYPISLINVCLLLWTFGPKLPGKHIHFQVKFPFREEIGFLGSKKVFFFFLLATFLKNPP
jgi:hypothetical protein